MNQAMANHTTVLIAEDEALIRTELARLVQLCWPEARIIALAQDGAEAFALWQQHEPEVMFLDIQMPEMSGLEVAAAIHEASGDAVKTRQTATQIVFITAYNEHAIAAFDAGAIDYLLKPVKEERLRTCIARLTQRALHNEIHNTAPDMNAMLREIKAALGHSKEPLRWLSASVGQQIKLIAVEDVLFFQSDNKYTRVVTANSEALIRKTMKELQDELDEKLFAQIHRSTIVNLRAIDSVLRDVDGKGNIRLKGSKEVLAVSSTFMARFRQL